MKIINIQIAPLFLYRSDFSNLFLEFSENILGPYPGNAEAFCVGFSDVSWNETARYGWYGWGLGVGGLGGLKSADVKSLEVTYNSSRSLYLVDTSIYTHWKLCCEIKIMIILIQNVSCCCPRFCSARKPVATCWLKWEDSSAGHGKGANSYEVSPSSKAVAQGFLWSGVTWCSCNRHMAIS